MQFTVTLKLKKNFIFDAINSFSAILEEAAKTRNEKVPNKPHLLSKSQHSSLLAHLKDIKVNQFIQENNIIALQETWLTDKQCKNLINPFVIHSIVYYNRKSQSSSQQSPGGGVALLIH